MTPQEQEIEKMKKVISSEIRKVLTSNMTIFDWDIPENNDRKSAELIFTVMQEEMDILKQEIEIGKFDQY
ncbi:MAG: hypothetical protein L3J43_08160 [Sulfurovum sp.]|nr:hypothetical protein [Sulfurovum sp.]